MNKLVTKLTNPSVIKAVIGGVATAVVVGGLHQQLRISELERTVRVQDQKIERDYKLLCEHVPRYPWHDMPKEGGAFDLYPDGAWIRNEKGDNRVS